MFRTIGHLVRLARAGWVLAREGVFAGVDPAAIPPVAKLPLALANLVARRHRDGEQPDISRAIGKLGPSYVKMGQFLATRPDVVGVAAARGLEGLQDRMQPFDRALAVKTIEAAFSKTIDQLFTEFGPPIAAASIAQVHKALVSTPDGVRQVAVKVLRPGIERRFWRDLRDMYFAARFAEARSAEARRLRLVEVVQTLERSVMMEMDFRLEAAAASEFAENLADDPDFRVPDVDWDRTSREVLTTSWIDGIPLSDVKAIREAGHNLEELGSNLIQSFLRHALRDGLFHADMHQGNLFVDKNGVLVAVDFGIMGRLGMRERRFLAEILFGFITRNYRRVAEVHFEAGYVPRIHQVDDFAQAVRAIGEPIHSRTADQISMASLLTLLFEITALFDMETRTELVMLQKTMVVVEGVGRSLDPKLNVWAASEPVVGTWIREKLGPRGIAEDAGRGLAVVGNLARQVPDLLERAQLIADDFQAQSRRPATVTPQAAGASRWTTAALWIIAALLAVLVFGR
ncbi:MAG: 2-polyprenylphenol 6-hydroxylase [Hyphomicrobiales bacterium]|nr:2-polyprenylphenol 6-hydroxylase [Hyphomicrobiales bacterium]